MIVYSYYCLDIIHRGHLLMLENAKVVAGDGLLIVGILTDKAIMEKKPKPVLPFEERLELAKAIKYIDLVVPQEKYSPLDNIFALEPDILMESASHDELELEELKRLMARCGGKVIVMPYYPEQSSTDIKNKIKGD